MSGSDFEEVGSSQAISTVGKASKLATDGTQTLKSLSSIASVVNTGGDADTVVVPGYLPLDDPGEEVCFEVTMKAPKREGIAISYWRLKGVDGIPFGHRLWCHINVTSNSSAPQSSAERSVPAVGRPGNGDSA